MRIIAGVAKGRSLSSPKGQQTRPTQDYVRESLFNIIQRDVQGATVLDLFAGTGALALEALSRGADHAVLADKARQAVDCIRHNVQALGFTGQSEILLGDWKRIAQKLQNRRFDLIFLDPPYKLTQYREITDALSEHNALADDALIIIEHKKEVQPILSPMFCLKDSRTYGDTVIHFYRFRAGGDNHEE